jgi:hypothetical protein
MLARIQAGSVSCFSGLSLFKLLVSPSDVSRTPSEQKPAMWRIDLSRAMSSWPKMVFIVRRSASCSNRCMAQLQHVRMGLRIYSTGMLPDKLPDTLAC